MYVLMTSWMFIVLQFLQDQGAEKLKTNILYMLLGKWNRKQAPTYCNRSRSRYIVGIPIFFPLTTEIAVHSAPD